MTTYKRQLFSGSRIEISFEGRLEVVVVEFGDASQNFETSAYVWPQGKDGEAEPVHLWTDKGSSPEESEEMDDLALSDHLKENWDK